MWLVYVGISNYCGDNVMWELCDSKFFHNRESAELWALDQLAGYSYKILFEEILA